MSDSISDALFLFAPAISRCASPFSLTRPRVESLNLGLKYLASEGEPIEENVIHEAVEARRATKQKALRKLVTEGKLTRTGTGKKVIDTAIKMLVSKYPTIYRHQKNQSPKTALSDSHQKGNAGTRLPTSSEQGAEILEQV